VIRREVMEAHFPDFVKKVDKLVREADDFCREVCPPPQSKHISKKKTPRSKKHNDPRQSKIRIEILATLDIYGLMRLKDIARLSNYGYESVAAKIRDMKAEGEVVSPERGFYKKGAPRQERT